MPSATAGAPCDGMKRFFDILDATNQSSPSFSLILLLSGFLLLATGFWVLTIDFWMLTSDYWYLALAH